MIESTAYTSPTLHVLLLAALYHESCRRPVAEGTTLAHAVGQSKGFTEFGDLPLDVKRGRILTAATLLQNIEITGVTQDSTGALDAMQVEWLAATIHNAERPAVEAGLTAVKLDPPRPWVEYSDLPELAQQGRERQASFLLKRFIIEPRLASGVQFPSTWDLTAQCEAVATVLDRMMADIPADMRASPESTAHVLSMAIMALRGATEQSRGLGLLKAQVEAVLSDIAGSTAAEDDDLKSHIAEKDTPATAARLLQLGLERGAFAVNPESEDAPTAESSDAARARSLWHLLDDVDTADDMAKDDDKLFRGMAMQAARRRELFFTCPDGRSLVPVLEAERSGIAERIKQWEEKLTADAKQAFGRAVLDAEYPDPPPKSRANWRITVHIDVGQEFGLLPDLKTAQGDLIVGAVQALRDAHVQLQVTRKLIVLYTREKPTDEVVAQLEVLAYNYRRASIASAGHDPESAKERRRVIVEPYYSGQQEPKPEKQEADPAPPPNTLAELFHAMFTPHELRPVLFDFGFIMHNGPVDIDLAAQKVEEAGLLTAPSFWYRLLIERPRRASDILRVMAAKPGLFEGDAAVSEIRSILEAILGRTPDPARSTVQLAREVTHYMEVMREEIRRGGRRSEQTFRDALQAVVNRFNKESGSNTPDFILAGFLAGALEQWDKATAVRDLWYGVELKPGAVIGKGDLPAPDMWEPDASTHGEQGGDGDPEAPRRAIRRAATAKLEQLAGDLETSMPGLAADLRRRYLGNQA